MLAFYYWQSLVHFRGDFVYVLKCVNYYSQLCAAKQLNRLSELGSNAFESLQRSSEPVLLLAHIHLRFELIIPDSSPGRCHGGTEPILGVHLTIESHAWLCGWMTNPLGST